MAGEDVPAPSFDAGQGLVAGGKDTAGDQHVPQVVGGPLVRMIIQRLMGEGCAAGCDIGEDRGGRSGPQPVERRVWGPGGGDGLDDAIQRDGTLAASCPARSRTKAAARCRRLQRAHRPFSKSLSSTPQSAHA